MPIILEKNASAFSFGNTVNVSNTSFGVSSAPQVQAEGENVFVVWEDDDSGANEILFAKSPDRGASFADSVIVSTTASSAFDPQLAKSVTANEIYVVWKEEGEIYFATGTDNMTSFDDPVNVSNSGNASRSPQVTVAGSHVYVAWEEDVTGLGTMDIFVSATDDGGLSFTEPINLSNSSLQSSSVQLYSSDDTLFIIWKEFDISAFSGDILFSSSVDGGQTFTDSFNLSETLGGDAFFPQIAVSGANIYVVWGDAINLETFLAVSTDGGQTFGEPLNLSTSGFVFAANPDIVTSGGKAYVVWQDEIGGLADIFLASISDAGGTIGSPVNVSNSGTISFSPKIAASGTNPETIYVVWQEDSPADVFLAVSTDGGTNFDEPVNLSSTDSVGFSASSQVSTWEDRLYVIWEDNSIGEFEVFSRTIIDSGPPSVTIDLVSNSTPRWDLDPVSISGTVSGNSTDSITIEWGDGESDPGIPVDGSSWGPVFHTYDAAGTGTREIVVTLSDALGAQKASASTQIEVQRHETSLSLDNIFSVVQGTDISIGGILMDTDANVPLAGKTINFTGTGVTASFPSALTLGDGTFSQTGASPDIVSDATLIVQAHFAEDTAYKSSVSNLAGYDTVAAGTTEFIVPGGSPTGPIDLTGFNASIVFDSVSSSGSIFVSECTAPSSSRYIEIEGMCLKISSAVELVEGSSAHITISYDGLPIPTGYSEADLDIFHDSVSGIVDITESRDTEENSVTGRTTEFSRFLGGVARHSDPPVGAERLPIFVGDNNDLVFEFPETRQLSFSNEELTLGSVETVTVTDPYANTRNEEIDTFNATISSTSDPQGIAIEFHETGPNTGTFKGTFSLTGGSSSSSELHAAPNDEISGSYEVFGMPPFRVVIKGVTEAGIAQVTNAGIPIYLRPSPSAVDAYELRLVDARLGPDANVTVIMSYENFQGVSDPLALGISHFDPLDQANCLDVISSSNLDGIDTAAKTITGYATAVGGFALVHDDHIPADQECFALGVPPAGGGGGLPRPGTGIILLDSARAIAGGSDDSQSIGGSGGGGGGGGPRSAGITQPPSGSDVETSVTTESGSLTLVFESIDAGSGPLKVESSQLSSFGEIFDGIAMMTQDNDEHGIVRLNSAIYSTAGKIFDIDVSEVNYHGTVEVTIPYDERAVTILSGSESDVRFLHYDEEKRMWNDATSSADQLANTVTGILDSLSPVVAAVIASQGITFDEDYLEENPLARMEVASPSFSISDQTGEVTVTTTINNMQRINQEYVIVTQIVDENNVAQYIDWHAGSAASGQSGAVSINWKPLEKGSHSLMILVLTELDRPVILSKAVMTDVDIQEL